MIIPLQHIPDIFGCVAEFAASHTSTEAVVADRDGIILEGIGKVIAALGHGANEDADTLIWVKCLNIIPHSNHVRVKGQSDFSALWRQMVGDRVFDDFEKLLLRVHRSNGQFVKKLYHQTSESLECSRYTNSRAYFDENTFGGVDVNLKPAGFVDWRIQ